MSIFLGVMVVLCLFVSGHWKAALIVGGILFAVAAAASIYAGMPAGRYDLFQYNLRKIRKHKERMNRRR